MFTGVVLFLRPFRPTLLSLVLKNVNALQPNGIKYLFQLISDPQQRFVALKQGPLFFCVTISQSGHLNKE
jgi:hypothetical protein